MHHIDEQHNVSHAGMLVEFIEFELSVRIPVVSESVRIIIDSPIVPLARAIR
jgi:hypothetical protein